VERHQVSGCHFCWGNFAIWLAKVLYTRGDSRGSQTLLQSVGDAAVHGGSVLLTVIASAELALLAAATGLPGEAAPHLTRCRAILTEGEDWRGLAGRVALAEAAVAVAERRSDHAAPHFEQAIEVFRAYSLPWDEAEAFHLWGRGLIQATSRSTAIEKLRESLNIYCRHGAGRPWLDRVRADLRRAGGEPADATLAYPAGLSEREVEVLRLLAGGMSNPAIAGALVLSVHTVERHVANIYAKIGAHGRADATAYAIRNGLL
jgi:DNA-binding CsgD family transcriptional regulator